MSSPTTHPTPFPASPTSFTPRQEIVEAQRGEGTARQLAAGWLTLSGTSVVRLSSVQPELVASLSALLASSAAPSPAPAVPVRAALTKTSSPSTGDPSSSPVKPSLARAPSSDSFVLVASPASGLPDVEHPLGPQGPPRATLPRPPMSTDARGVWPLGVLSSKAIQEPGRTGSLRQPGGKPGGKTVGKEWTLGGTPWKMATHEELESVRLCVAIAETITRSGWSIGSPVRAGTRKADHHTFLLSSTSNLAPSDRSTTSTFAISFPRPDTISIVDPPHALTPAILQAARAATGEEAVQDEGWVPGSQQTAAGRKVYKLKVKGFKTWWKPGVSKARYQSRIPAILARLLQHLSTVGVTLLATIQLRPTTYYRDLWILSAPPSAAASVLLEPLVESPAGTLDKHGQPAERPVVVVPALPPRAKPDDSSSATPTSDDPSAPAHAAAQLASSPAEVVPLASFERAAPPPPAASESPTSPSRFVEGRSSAVDSLATSSAYSTAFLAGEDH